MAPAQSKVAIMDPRDDDKNPPSNSSLQVTTKLPSHSVTEAFTTFSTRYAENCSVISAYKSALHFFKSTVQEIETTYKSLQGLKPPLKSSTIQTCRFALTRLQARIQGFESKIKGLEVECSNAGEVIDTVSADMGQWLACHDGDQANKAGELIARMDGISFGLQLCIAVLLMLVEEIGVLNGEAGAVRQAMKLVPEVHLTECCKGKENEEVKGKVKALEDVIGKGSWM